MKFPDSPFWNYSTQIFQLAEVAEACLAMQAELDADVNLLLFCCWSGDRYQLLDTDDFKCLIEASKPWQDAIIRPLREARKLMKNQIIAMPANLHNRTINNLSEMELNAEHMEQLDLEKAIRLEANCDANAKQIDIAARNLMAYTQQLEKAQVVDANPHIAALLKHIYGDEEQAQMALMMAMA